MCHSHERTRKNVLALESDWVFNIRVENKRIDGKKKFFVTLALRVTPKNNVFPKRFEPFTRVQYGGALVNLFTYNHLYHTVMEITSTNFSSLASQSLRTITNLKARHRDDTIYSPRMLVVGQVSNFPPFHVAILKVKSYICLKFGI